MGAVLEEADIEWVDLLDDFMMGLTGMVKADETLPKLELEYFNSSQS